MPYKNISSLFNIHLCALSSSVATGNHTYLMAWCLPGVRSRKAITPMANKYPEDLQYPGYLHFVTVFYNYPIVRDKVFTRCRSFSVAISSWAASLSLT